MCPQVSQELTEGLAQANGSFRPRRHHEVRHPHRALSASCLMRTRKFEIIAAQNEQQCD